MLKQMLNLLQAFDAYKFTIDVNNEDWNSIEIKFICLSL